MKKVKYKKRIRLKNFDYKGVYRYYVTICVNNRESVFTKSESVTWMIKMLKEISSKYNFLVYAYCFMPDQLHLLIEGVNEHSDMRKFIAMFKQKTGYHYKNKFGKRLWEINYYEHVLRKDESTKDIANYIFENPVRKGIVNNYEKYPYLGSFVFEL